MPASADRPFPRGVCRFRESKPDSSRELRSAYSKCVASSLMTGSTQRRTVLTWMARIAIEALPKPTNTLCSGPFYRAHDDHDGTRSLMTVNHEATLRGAFVAPGSVGAGNGADLYAGHTTLRAHAAVICSACETQGILIDVDEVDLIELEATPRLPSVLSLPPRNSSGFTTAAFLAFS